MTNKEAAEILKDNIFITNSPKVEEACHKAIEALEAQGTYDRICRPVPDPEWNKRFEEIEKALGFKLFIWQKTYIIKREFRQFGATTAQILQELLDLDKGPIDYSKKALPREAFYRFDLIQMKEKLDEAGIPTRPVFRSAMEKKMYFDQKVNTKQSKLNFINKLTDQIYEIVEDYNKKYEEVVLECLSKYGIAKENISENANRIRVEEFAIDLYTNNSKLIRYFIDGVYAFSIEIGTSVKNDTKTMKFEIHYTYKPKFEDGLNF